MDIRKLKNFTQSALRHLRQFGTREDFLIVLEIAVHQRDGAPMTLKQLTLWGEVPESTLKRRLSRLLKLGLIRKTAADGDRRIYLYQVSDKVLDQLSRFHQELKAFRWN